MNALFVWSSQVNASLVRVCDNAMYLVQSDYISVCYGNIKNIRAVKIFIVRAFHFFSLIVSLVFNMLLVADPSILVWLSLYSFLQHELILMNVACFAQADKDTS